MADNKKYVMSDAVKQAQAALQQHQAQKPGAYQSQWQQTLNDTINKIQNREKFTYDLNGDALYQQYKDRAVQQGQQAMMDTMGQAAALTGGYGNSYAQSVGQQTYQGYLQGLNDKIPELYNLALQQYQAEGDNLMQQYGLLADRENVDYGRYRDQMGDYNTQLNMLLNQYNNERSFDYGQYRDAAADAKWQAEFDEAKRQYEQQYAASQARSSGGGGGGGGSDTASDGTPEAEGPVSPSVVISSLKSDFPSGVVTDGQSWTRAIEMLKDSGYSHSDAISVLNRAGFSVKVNTNRGHSVGNQEYMIN